MYALANGGTNSGDVSQMLDIKQTTASKYLGKLKKLGYIKYVTPITNPNGKNGKFVINSPYYHFWFRFLYKNLYVYHNESKAQYDMEDNQDAFIIENYFSEYCKFWIERNLLVKDITWGEWWDTEYRLDIVGVCEDKKNIYIGKYFDKTVIYKDYEKMRAAANKLEMYNKYNKIYIMFSFEDFDDELSNLSNQNIYLEKLNIDTTDNQFIFQKRL